jgi:S-adenosylmethionine synthetase
LIDLDKTLPSIVHYSSTVGMTKYKQLVIIASCLSLPHGHVRPDDRPPAPDAAVQRPGNTQLSVDGVKEIGVSIEEDQDSFEKWWQRWARSRRA